MNPNIPEKKSNFMFGVALVQMKRVQIALIVDPFRFFLVWPCYGGH